MGYEDAISRVSELRAMTLGAPVAAAPPAGEQAATAARFQQQMLAAGLAEGGDPAAAAGATAALDPTKLAAAGADPYAAMQGGGLSTQAALLAQMTGAAGAPGGSAALATGVAGLSGVQGIGAVSGATAAAPAAPTFVTGKLKGLDPELVSRLDQVGRAIGTPIDVISGNRTYAEQAQLYQKYLNGTGNLAAPPGRSNHENGEAADVYVKGVALADVPGARAAAAKLGLHFPVGGESWHVERTDL